MPFPRTVDELKRDGYERTDARGCAGCKGGAKVIWWRTPKGKMMPMDEDADGNVKSHFSTCREAGRFRGRSERS